MNLKKKKMSLCHEYAMSYDNYCVELMRFEKLGNVLNFFRILRDLSEATVCDRQQLRLNKHFSPKY